MRASATSRISSAHLPAAQKPDNNVGTNKADDASPFALLVKEAAPKDAGKPSHKDAHSSDDKPAHVRHHGKKDADTTAKPAQAQTSNKASSKDTQSASDKPDDKQTAKADEKPVAAISDDAKSADPAAKTGKTEKSDDQTTAEQDDGNQPQAAAAPDQAVVPQPVAAHIQPAIQPVPANDDSGDADQSVAENQNIKAAQPAAPAAPAAPADDQAQDVQAAQGKTQAAKPAAKPAKSDGAKTDVKTGAKPEDIKADKENAETTAAANNADIKATAANAALNDKAAAVHDAAASRQGDTNPVAVNSLASASQGQQPAQNAQVTQHVQVSAQPTPNVAGLAVQIAAKSLGGAKQFDIRLDPPELGRVEVRLSIDATGKASAHLSADQPQTLDLLQKDAPALTRALREAGLDVSQDGLNFSLRHQGGQDANTNNGGNRGAGRSFNLAATTSIDATATSAAYRSVADGRLDIRV